MSEAPFQLSRFAVIHRVGDDLVAETPLSAARVVLADGRWLAAIDVLRAPTTVADLAERLDVEVAEAGAMVAVLRDARLVTGDAEDGALATWEWHDLLFHARTRVGRSDAPAGGTYRFAAVNDPPPAIAPLHGELIPLERPDFDRLLREDPPFALVQESRLSQRRYGAAPIAVAQLSELLYRVARVADTWAHDVATPSGATITLDGVSRPYPSAGGLYELEFYVAVHRCAGIDAGVYAYDPVAHGLRRVAGEDGALPFAIDAAKAAAIDPATVQVVLVTAARFARLAWKYETIAYSLLLKNVGVVMATTYLAATAMNLAVCALGRGDSDLFARVTGHDYYECTSVGELLIGSAP